MMGCTCRALLPAPCIVDHAWPSLATRARPVASSRQRGAQDGLPTVTTLRGFIRTPASASQAGYSLEHEGVHKGSPSKDTFFSKSDKDFQSLGLLPELCEALSKLGYERPAHIQALAFRALQRAQTFSTESGPALLFGDCAGSGKTLAYLLPILDALRREELSSSLSSVRAAHAVRALIMLPTTELCRQVVGLLRRLAARGGFPLRTLGLTTSAGTASQLSQLRQGADIAVATPSRINALLNEKALSLAGVRFLVLDEVDVLLDNTDFPEQTKRVLESVPREAARVAATASLPPEVHSTLQTMWPGLRAVVGRNLHRPAPSAMARARVIDCSGGAVVNEDTGFERKAEALQRVLAPRGSGERAKREGSEEDDRSKSHRAKPYGRRRQQQDDDKLLIDAPPPSSRTQPTWRRVIVFCNKIVTCRKVENYLNRHVDLPPETRVVPFHAAIQAHLRKEHLKEFLGPAAADPADKRLGSDFLSKTSNNPIILVATDRASRGLDTDNLDHVILFDLPRDPSEFLRRIGRAVRGPSGGECATTVLVLGRQVPWAKEMLRKGREGIPLYDIPV